MKFIQATTDEQLLLIRNLAEEIWPIAFRDIISMEQIAYMIDWMYDLKSMQKQISEKTTYHLVYADDSDIEPAGFCGYTEYADEKILKLDKVYVRSRYQGKGVGRAILDYSQEFSVAQGLKSVILATNKKNEKAISFYKKNNFRIIKSVKDDIGGGFFMDDYILERTNNDMR